MGIAAQLGLDDSALLLDFFGRIVTGVPLLPQFCVILQFCPELVFQYYNAAIQILLTIQEILDCELGKTEELDKIWIEYFFALQTIIDDIVDILVDCQKISLAYYSVYVYATCKKKK